VRRTDPELYGEVLFLELAFFVVVEEPALAVCFEWYGEVFLQAQPVQRLGN